MRVHDATPSPALLEQFLTLLVLDGRSARRNLWMAMMTTLVGTALLIISDHQSAWGEPMAGVGIVSFVLAPAAVAFRNRVEGTLWLVSTLPVSARLVASTRFAGAGLACVPATTGLVVLAAATPLGRALSVPQLLLLSGVAWILLTTLSILILVPTFAYSAGRLHWVVLTFLGIMMASGWTLDHFVPNPMQVAVSVADHPRAIAMMFAGAIAAWAAALLAGFLLVARAIARFEQPEVVRAALTRGRWSD